jgi:hypothetical protein
LHDAIKSDAGAAPVDKKLVELIDATIHLFAPMKDGGKYIALIGNMSYAFKGNTPLAAHKRADDWRKGEWEKITSKAHRERHAATKAPAKAAASADVVQP